jgi:hypothetical protein
MRGLQRRVDVGEDLFRLCREIVLAYKRPVFAQRDLTGQVNRIARRHDHHVGITGRLRQARRIEELSFLRHRRGRHGQGEECEGVDAIHDAYLMPMSTARRPSR